MTFDVKASLFVGVQYGWLKTFETFCVCRHCDRATIFRIAQTEGGWDGIDERNQPERFRGSLNTFFDVRGFVNLTDNARVSAPEHTPPEIAAIFAEAASSIALSNWNAAGAMFRLAINLATKPLLPKEQIEGLTRRKKRDLGPRVEWLMENGKIAKDLFDLSECIREDGNDGAHDGTLTKEDADDLLDFTVALFERMFTEPQRRELAKERRAQRRKSEPE